MVATTKYFTKSTWFAVLCTIAVNAFAILIALSFRDPEEFRRRQREADMLALHHEGVVVKTTNDYVKATIYDEADHEVIIPALQNTYGNLDEIYFMSSPGLQPYEWRQEDAVKVLNQYRHAFPKTKIDIFDGAF